MALPELSPSASAPSPRLELVTATWKGDLEPFTLMRAALSRSAFATIPHRIAVHSEDIDHFGAFSSASARILPTREILPGALDRHRQLAIERQRKVGRTLTKWMTSTARFGWPRWVRAMGWQVQQITKLEMVAESDADLVLVIDSDVITTRHARPDDCVSGAGTVAYRRPVDISALRGKTAKWNQSAHHLLAPAGAVTPGDDHFDTPFPMAPLQVREMMAYLEKRHGAPWWKVLLQQPPRRWSEFACYRAFLHHHVDPALVKWQAPLHLRYLYADSADPKVLAERAKVALDDPACAFLTIHSQSSGKRLIEAAAVAATIAPLIERHYAEP